MSHSLLPFGKHAPAFATSQDSLQSVQHNIADMNKLKEREVLNASLLYARSGKMSAREILEGHVVSVDFADFCKSLGWVFSLCITDNSARTTRLHSRATW
jgi:hypothetical protein